MNNRIVKQWKNRRRMAWGAYLSGLVFFPVMAVHYPELMGLSIPYYTFITFLLTSYYSFATYHDIKEGEKDV